MWHAKFFIILRQNICYKTKIADKGSDSCDNIFLIYIYVNQKN